MSLKTYILISVLLFITQTSFGQMKTLSPDNIITEIRKIEKQFETDLNTFGAAFAFEKYAAEEAAIKRGDDSVIIGKKAIKDFYSADIYKGARAKWSPDFIDVSEDGTMAYTYGKYQWSMIDKSGQTRKYTGIFHTVWKKQKNGSWKYVWD